MSYLRVLISHAHDEKSIAEAWKELIDSTSLGAIETWFSSDQHTTGGISVGTEWRTDLYNRLNESDFIIAIQTPASSGRPWIIWECAVGSGIEKTRGIIPITYSMGRSELTNPLSSYQVYQGENEDQVREVCMRLAQEAGLRPSAHVFIEPLKSYIENIALHRPRKALRQEQMTIWRNRFEELIEIGRDDEIITTRQLMYSSLGKPFQPIEPTIHELLSRILLDQKEFKIAIEEVDYALTLIDDDVKLLHRKALSLVELHNLQDAEILVQHIISLNNDLQSNAEIASLQGRIHREKWEVNSDSKDLDAAIEAYSRAYQADTRNYYPGINAATLLLKKGDTISASQIFNGIISTGKNLQQRNKVSYWVDFSMGEAYLGLGEEEAAFAEYKNGLSRVPAPPLRDRHSALKGSRRIMTVKGLAGEIKERIEAMLS